MTSVLPETTPTSPRGPAARAGPSTAAGLRGVLCALSVLLLAPGLHAQEGRTAVSAWSGLPLPAEDLARVVDGGWHAGLGVEHRVTDRIGVMLTGGRTYLDPVARADLGLERAEAGPPVILWRYIAGLVFELTDPSNRWEVSLNGGVGGGTHDVKREEAAAGFFETAASRAFRTADVNTGPAATFGMRVGPDLAEQMGIFFQAQFIMVSEDADDSSTFLGRDGLYTGTFGVSYRF